MASCVARAPNTSTGIASGSTSSDSSAPPRRTPSVSPAPIAPIRLSDDAAQQQRHADARHRRGGAPRLIAASGPASASGRPVSSQCVAVLASSSAVNDCPDNAILLQSSIPRVFPEQEIQRQQR